MDLESCPTKDKDKSGSSCSIYRALKKPNELGNYI